MKKLLALLLVSVLTFSLALPAMASNFYIIPDSNSRNLTREELWEWQYEALGYILNEIFARHGYHFNPGEKYDNYFRSQLWYRENTTYRTNQEIYDKLMNNIEWNNQRLVKDVRQEMRNQGTTNPDGKALPTVSYEPPISGAFSSFKEAYFAADQRLAVYTGPGEHYYRAADGKALASTNGSIYVGGWDNGWLFVMYWTNDGHVRVGYANSADFKDKINASMLTFNSAPATVNRKVTITDDPVATYQRLATLESGTKVTYLTEYVNEYRWAYVEVTVNGQRMRGFVEADAVTLDTMELDNIGK